MFSRPWHISGWEPKSCSKLLQAETTQDHVCTELSYNHSDGRSCKFTCTYVIHIFTEFCVCVINFKNWKSLYLLWVSPLNMPHQDEKPSQMWITSQFILFVRSEFSILGDFEQYVTESLHIFLPEIFTSCFRIGFLSPNQYLVLFRTSTCMNNYLKQKTLDRFLLIKLNSYVEDQFRDVCMNLHKNPCKTRGIKLPYPQHGWAS